MSNEPLKRCVRCKTKKKGCSRGSPCERCALAGFTAEECIYLDSDSTYRNIKPRKKDPTAYTPKAPSYKVAKALPSHVPEPGTIVRCSRCIRTARGCSHERPCEPCREHGLSEWECRYTSASSFKVRGPGARAVRKIRSLERMATLATTDGSDDENGAVEAVRKQARSLSTGSVLVTSTHGLAERAPVDYRTPSPPTNISPISEPPNWRDARESSSPTGVTPVVQGRDSLAVPIPGAKDVVVRDGAPGLAVVRVGAAAPSANSVEPPPMMTLIPSVSQQSHTTTIPESSPAVYTDDYQSSPSPFNSPQFQSSPPVHYGNIAAMPGRPASFPNEAPMFPPQAPYRPPAGYNGVLGHARQQPVSQAHPGFAVAQTQSSSEQPYLQPHGHQHPQQQSSPRQHAQRLQAQQRHQLHQMQQQQLQQQQRHSQSMQGFGTQQQHPPSSQPHQLPIGYGSSPPYPRQQHSPAQFSKSPGSNPAQLPRHRAVPTPSPRYQSPARRPSYEHRVQSQARATNEGPHRVPHSPQTHASHPQAIPGRGTAFSQYVGSFSASPLESHVGLNDQYGDVHRQNGKAMVRQTSQQSQPSDALDQEYDEIAWPDHEFGVFGQVQE